MRFFFFFGQLPVCYIIRSNPEVRIFNQKLHNPESNVALLHIKVELKLCISLFLTTTSDQERCTNFSCFTRCHVASALPNYHTIVRCYHLKISKQYSNNGGIHVAFPTSFRLPRTPEFGASNMSLSSWHRSISKSGKAGRLLLLLALLAHTPIKTAHQMIVLWMKAQKIHMYRWMLHSTVSTAERNWPSFHLKAIQGAAKLDCKLGVVDVPWLYRCEFLTLRVRARDIASSGVGKSDFE